MSDKHDTDIASIAGRTFATFPVAVLAYVINKNGQFLLMRRPAKSTWEIPSGALERGEAPLDGVCRELREELGTDAVVDVLGVVHAVRIEFDTTISCLISLGFLIRHCAGDITPSDDMQGAEFVWLGLEELLTRTDIGVPNNLDHFRTAYRLYLCESRRF